MEATTRAVALSLRETMGRIGRQILELRDGDLDTKEKKGFNDIVTAGDTFSETVLTKWAEREFPDDGIRGEEGATKPSRSGYEWVFDPIDGTTLYASGLSGFAISAGRVSDGVSVMGALYFPDCASYFFANREEGVWSMNSDGGLYRFPERKQGVTLENAPMALDVTQGRSDLVEIFLKRSRGVLHFGSFVYEAAQVVGGRLSAHINTGATPFDAAAAVVIAEEAGCVVNGLDGKPIDLRKSKIPIAIAYNAEIMEEVLSICAHYK